jgi:hypothetical protein
MSQMWERSERDLRPGVRELILLRSIKQHVAVVCRKMTVALVIKKHLYKFLAYLKEDCMI